MRACNINTSTYNRSIKAIQGYQIMETKGWGPLVWRPYLWKAPPLQWGLQPLQEGCALQCLSWCLQTSQLQSPTSATLAVTTLITVYSFNDWHIMLNIVNVLLQKHQMFCFVHLNFNNSIAWQEQWLPVNLLVITERRLVNYHLIKAMS